MGPEDEFVFDAWARLAQENPPAFEEARRLMLDSLIESAPLSVQPRLKGLQWQIETIRERATTPLGACLKISNLMWQNVVGEKGLATRLQELGHGRREPLARPKSAEVVAFPQAPGLK